MTRTLSILTGALITLSAVAPVLAARALGTLEPHAAIAGACLDAPPAKAAPVAEPEAEGGSCKADESSEVAP
jgi:hypothetical protein